QNRVNKRIEENIDAWRSKLAKTEGIREGVANIRDWLNEEKRRQAEPIPLPLHVNKLVDLKQQNELKLRDLSSRQKVLAELQTEAKKIAAANPDSVASRQVLDDCDDAQKTFTTLLATSKAYGENITELTAALSNFYDSEKSVNEKLTSLDEKLSHTSLGDVTVLNESLQELTQMKNDDLVKLHQKCNWILAVPDVQVGANGLICLKANFTNTQDEETDIIDSLDTKFSTIAKSGSAIEKLKTTVGELITHGREIEEQQKAYDELKNKLVASLEDTETKAQVLEKCTLNPVELAKQRSTCQQLQSVHQNCAARLEKLNEISSKLVELEAVARLKMKGSGAGQLEQTQATAVRDISSLQQRHDALGSLLRSRGEKISADSESLSDWDLKRDGLARWINSEIKRLAKECPTTLDSQVIEANIAKAIRLEEILAREKQPEIEEIRLKARPLMSDPTIPGTSEIVTGQKALENSWDELSKAAAALKKQNEFAKQLRTTDLDKWLKQRERMMSAIGTVILDPKVIDNQIIQLELLQNELEEQSGTRNKINELAHDLVTGSATAADAPQIVEQMDALNRRWISFQEQLAEKKTNLQNVKAVAFDFSTKQRDVKMQLLALAEEIEHLSQSPLTTKSDVAEQLEKLDKLGVHTSEVDAQMVELKQMANVICEFVHDHALQADIRDRFNATLQIALELNKKIESMKAAAASVKDEEGQTVKEAEAAVIWIRDMHEQLLDLGQLSAVSSELKEQKKAIETIYSAVLNKEGDITLLRAKLMNQIRTTPNPEQKAMLDALSAVWNPLLEESKAKRASAERAFDYVAQLENALKSFAAQVDEDRSRLRDILENKGSDVSALSEMEHKLSKQEAELTAMETLLHKLEALTAGPSFKKITKEIENAAADLLQLQKDVRNIALAAQMSKDVQNRFARCKEEARGLLTLTGFENSWQKKERELQATLKEVQGTVGREEWRNCDEEVRQIGADYAEVIASVNLLHSEMKKKDELLDAVKQKVVELGFEIRKVAGDEFAPIARNSPELEEQNRDCDALLAKIDEKEKALDELTTEWQQATQTGIVGLTQKNALIQQFTELKGDISKRRAAVTQRKRLIVNTQLALQEFIRLVRFTDLFFFPLKTYRDPCYGFRLILHKK
ncbi:unnamed protein product, partial [Gongylonema pulchrum]|uniref:Dystrophin n=1 Tax=Gongylonema pulchrum TaxID=637853 RepID=A0A183CUT8_9BILA